MSLVDYDIFLPISSPMGTMVPTYVFNVDDLLILGQAYPSNLCIFAREFPKIVFHLFERSMAWTLEVILCPI